MKYLESFSSNTGEPYHVVSDLELYKKVKLHKLHDFTEKELSGIGDLTIKRVSKGIISMMIPIKQSSRFIVGRKKLISITKSGDEWYFVTIRSNNSNSFRVGVDVTYQCDQFDSLLKLLDDIKEGKIS